METLLWFVSDSRGGIHQTLLEKEQEYQQYQLNVLAAAHDIAEASVSNQQYDDVEEKSEENPLEIPEPSAESTSAFEMKDLSDNEDSLDDSIKQEIRMKEANRNEYFDNLDDILE